MAITVERLEAQVEADSAKAVADLAALDVALDVAARDRTATINVDTDNGAAQTQALLQALNGLGQSVTDSLDSVASALGGVGGAAAQATPSVDSLGGAAGGAGKSLTGMGGSMGGLIMQVVSAIPQIAAMGFMITGIYSAATIAAGALQMLAAAAAGLVAAVAPLVGLLGAIPVGLGAIGGGLGTVLLGLGGVSKAVTALGNAENATARSTYSATQAARELKSARQGIVDANKAVVRAEKDLAKAQQGVSEARRQAARDLVEQRRAVRDAVWAEEDAVDRLKRAQENLAKAQAGVGKSGAVLTKETDDFTGKVYEVARISADATDQTSNLKDAQQELVHAQENLQRSTEKRKDLQADLADMEKKGIERSDKVVQAIQRVADAQDALSRSHDNVAAANERLARVQEEQARRAAGGAAANNALNLAMSKLTPTGQKFAHFIHDEMMPAFESLQKAAQDGLLPGVEAGLKRLLKVVPDIRKEVTLYAEGMGAAFDDLMKHMTAKPMVKDLKELGVLFREVLFGDSKKKTKGLVDALIPLADIIVSVTKAAGPMTKMLTNGLVGGLERLSDWMKKPANAKKMEAFFDRAGVLLGEWGKVLRPIAGIFDSIVKAASPLADWMLKGIGDWLDGTDKKLKDPKGFKTLQQWFEDMKPAIRETAGLIKDIVKAIFGPQKQGTEDSAFTKTIKAMRTDWIPAIEHLLDTLGSDTKSGPAFVGFLTSATKAIDALVQNPEQLTKFIDDVANVVEALADLTKNIQKAADSPAWDALYAMTVPFPLQLTSMWVDARRRNMDGINDFEATTKPRLKVTQTLMATMMDFIPFVGPVLSRVFTFITDRWLDIIGIFTSGDIAGAIGRKFADIGVNLRRGFAKALNPLIEAYNNIAGTLHLPRQPYIDAYTERGLGNTGHSTAGSGGGVYNEGAGTGSKTASTPSYTTGKKAPMRAFGGPVQGGQSYIVGEKRAEVLTLAPGTNGRIAAAVPRPMQSTGGGLTEEQLDRVLQKVLDKAKPNVDMKVEQHEHADPKLLADEIAWSLR